MPLISTPAVLQQTIRKQGMRLLFSLFVQNYVKVDCYGDRHAYS